MGWVYAKSSSTHLAGHASRQKELTLHFARGRRGAEHSAATPASSAHQEVAYLQPGATPNFIRAMLVVIELPRRGG